MKERICLSVAMKARSTIPRQARLNVAKSLSTSCKVSLPTLLPLHALCRKTFWRTLVLPYSLQSCTLWQQGMSRNAGRVSTDGQLAFPLGSVCTGSSREVRLPVILEWRLPQRKAPSTPSSGLAPISRRSSSFRALPKSAQLVFWSLLGRVRQPCWERVGGLSKCIAAGAVIWYLRDVLMPSHRFSAELSRFLSQARRTMFGD